MKGVEDFRRMSFKKSFKRAAARSLQLCLTLCDPIDGSPPGSPVPGILQARTLEWVAISFSNAWKWKVKSLSRVRLLITPWTAAHQAPPSMGLSRQEYWSGVPWNIIMVNICCYCVCGRWARWRAFREEREESHGSRVKNDLSVRGYLRLMLQKDPGFFLLKCLLEF